MTLAEAITAIETHEFAARLGAASDWASLLTALESAEPVVDLLRDTSNARRVAERVIDLAAREIDPRYEHPLDAALTAYLVALSRMDRDLAELAATVVLRIPQLWWASKVARQTLLETNTRSTAEVHAVTADQRVGRVESAFTTSSRNSDEMILVIPFVARNVNAIAGGRFRPGAQASSSAERVYGAMVISANNTVDY
jgi:hypothetical protein